MRVAVFGLGYVGFTAACCISSEGHEVVGVDVSDTKIADVNAGLPLFEEPGLEALIQKGRKYGGLSATRDAKKALHGADLAFVCVGTPSGADGSHNMGYIIEVSRQIAIAMANTSHGRTTVVFRSTMRPGSMRQLIEPIFRGTLGADFRDRVELLYYPEFLREAQAISDYFNPPRIVIGSHDGSPSRVLDALNAGLNAPQFVTNFEVAEMTKFVDNSWHAVKVAFANELGRVCEKMNISASLAHEIFVSDTKLNISSYYTRPGGAFGGSCLPKDLRALQYIGSDVGVQLPLINSVLQSNEEHKKHQLSRIVFKLGDQLAGRSVLMVGLAFKAGTDDLRESPNVDLAVDLLNAGVSLRIYDPSIASSKLRGQNFSQIYSKIPPIDELLVSQVQAENGPWDLVIINNSTADRLRLSHFDFIETHRFA